MSEPRIFTRVGENLSVMGVAQLFTWVSSFLLLLFLPKYLGSKEFGLLFVALSVREIISMMIDFGGSHRIPKEIARDPKGNQQVLAQYLMMRVVIWLIVTLFLFAFGRILGLGEDLYPLISILLVANLFEGIAKTYRSFFQGIERMKIPSISLIAEKVFVSIISIGLLLSGADAYMIAGVFTAGTLLHLLFLWILSRREIRLKFSWNATFWNSIQLALPYFLWSLFSMIYYRIDALMLHAYSTQEVTGWYGGAYRFFDAVMILPALLKVALFPVFSRLAIDSNRKLSEIFEKSLRLVLLLAIPISLVIYIAASPIIEFFMGLEEYAPSVWILQIFCVGIPLMFADFILGSLLIGSADRQSVWAGIGFVAIVINVSLNIWLIPTFQFNFGNGGAGAAISTVVTELFILGSAILLLPKSYYNSFNGRVYTRLFLLTGCMLLFLWGFHYLAVPWHVQSLLIALLFGLSVWVLRLLSLDERTLLFDFLKQTIRLRTRELNSTTIRQEAE